MSGSVNKVLVIGTLGNDPEVRRFQGGGKVVNLRVATTGQRSGPGGTVRDHTEWHRVAIFDDRFGDFAERELRKGDEVYVEGKLERRVWTTKDGQERSSTEVAVRRFKGEISLLGDRPGDRTA